ncbi:hypothetical protein NLI96_g3967 [Meripilus lineatus]|uniref:Uncharacterized protein n=1 Tax=Meripilus lineatus TaxID=2056292 RepID=A0AAD5V5T5_9APHY|nr:hypothetical protein NLI96_g3967 [Physisporinus lineatus]
MNLYKDEAKDDPYDIEKLFSKLESQAAVVIKKIEGAGSSITLPRPDVNTLRKFLYLLNYRNSLRSAQFTEDKFDNATRAEVDTFRRAHGLKDFRSVWMFNMRNILTSNHWDIPNNKDIFYIDRSDYFFALQNMQLGFFTAHADIPFILTENGFGLYEGTTVPFLARMAMAVSPEVHPVHSAIPHTYTYALSPNFVVILRSVNLTEEQRALDEGVAPHLARPKVFGYTLTESFFADFPRTMADVTYNPPLRKSDLPTVETPDMSGPEDLFKPLMVGGRPVMSRLKDTLRFQIHPLTRSQAEKVNSLLLTNQRGILTFKTPSTLLASIEYYEMYCNLSSSGPPMGEPRFGKAPFGPLKARLRAAIDNVEPSSGDLDQLQVHPTSGVSRLGDNAVSGSIPEGDTPAPTPSASTSTANGATTSNVGKADGVSSALPGLRGAFSRRGIF